MLTLNSFNNNGFTIDLSVEEQDIYIENHKIIIDYNPKYIYSGNINTYTPITSADISVPGLGFQPNTIIFLNDNK